MRPPADDRDRKEYHPLRPSSLSHSPTISPSSEEGWARPLFRRAATESRFFFFLRRKIVKSSEFRTFYPGEGGGQRGRAAKRARFFSPFASERATNERTNARAPPQRRARTRARRPPEGELPSGGPRLAVALTRSLPSTLAAGAFAKITGPASAVGGEGCVRPGAHLVNV